PGASSGYFVPAEAPTSTRAFVRSVGEEKLHTMEALLRDLQSAPRRLPPLSERARCSRARPDRSADVGVRSETGDGSANHHRRGVVHHQHAIFADGGALDSEPWTLQRAS